jgi:hypothetical protein
MQFHSGTCDNTVRREESRSIGNGLRFTGTDTCVRFRSAFMRRAIGSSSGRFRAPSNRARARTLRGERRQRASAKTGLNETGGSPLAVQARAAHISGSFQQGGPGVGRLSLVRWCNSYGVSPSIARHNRVIPGGPAWPRRRGSRRNTFGRRVWGRETRPESLRVVLRHTLFGFGRP